MKPSIIDLFAGIGGVRIAFERAGFETLFSSEWDPHSQLTYAANFGEKPFGDIRDLSSSRLPKFDVLTAGFPCQPFSTIGKRMGFQDDDQGAMFHEILRILSKKKPKAIFLENVVGITTIDGGRTWVDIRSSLQTLGYHIESAVLDSSKFGVPQKRRRVFIVGFRNRSRMDSFKWPAELEGLADFGPHIEWGAEGYSISKHLQRSYIFKVGHKPPEVIDQLWEGPIKTLVASYHKVQRLTGTFVRDGHTGLRLLSELECKRAMGFPDNFSLPVSRTQMYRQMGNSVAVPIVELLAKEMHRVL